MIIGNLVCVSINDTDKLQEPVRAFITVNARNEKASYRPTIIALSEDEARAKVLDNATKELESFKRKYEALLDVAELLKDFAQKIAS